MPIGGVGYPEVTRSTDNTTTRKIAETQVRNLFGQFKFWQHLFLRIDLYGVYRSTVGQEVVVLFIRVRFPINSQKLYL